MSELTDRQRQQVASYEDHARAVGLTINLAETEWGGVFFTITAPGYGDVWCHTPIRINGKDHVLAGGYRLSYEFDRETGEYAANHTKPLVRLFGYPGFARLSNVNGLGATDTARRTLGRALGAIMEGVHG